MPAAVFDNKSRTLAATFHLTHACNLRCGYCYTGEKIEVGMTHETAALGVELAIREARAAGCDLLEIVFFGGEPLIRHRLLFEIVDRVRERAGSLRTSFKMSTNGLLLSDEVLEGLMKRRVFVSISVDGEPEVQDRQRLDILGQGTSQRLAEIVPKLLAWNPCTNVQCVVTPDSAGVVDRSVVWLYEQGFRFISTALDYGGAWDRAALERLEAAYQRLGDWYVDTTRAREKFYLSCFDEKIRSWTRGPLDRSERCVLGVRQFSIAPSGRLYPCVQFVREDEDPTFVLGDVVHGFERAAQQSLLDCSEAEKEECSGCAIQERCSSWCACVNWQSTGHVDRASPLVCEHERILMPIADRVANTLWRGRNRLFIHKHYNPAFPVLSFVEDVVIHGQVK